MSRAGQGGEVGSVFRCAVATYLAVHGLRSHPVPGLDLSRDVHPTRLDFETADPTDDIRVTFTDGRQAFISAKRKLSRGRPLQRSVQGWVAQIPLLGPQDLLIVAAEEFSGPMRKLDHVLRRHRADLPLETNAEKETLKAVTDLIADPDVAQIVLTKARVLAVPSSTSSGHAQSNLAALMDLVVEDAQGAGAVSALWTFFHQQAGQALGSNREQWVQALESNGLNVIRHPAGPAGARVAASIAAANQYRSHVSADRGRIDLTLLATDLPPVVVDTLLEAVTVKGEDDRTGTKLLWKVRRWRRLLLVGQPGTGKSVALREIAAHCALHPHGPLPLRIHLPALMQSNPARITVDLLIELATENTVAVAQVQPLREYATREVAAGRAIFLFDSLDECGKRAAWMAQQLADVKDVLDPRVGFVVSTRASGEAAAARLQLARLELEPPSNLDTTIDSVLTICADTRIPEDHRSAWLDARRNWMREAKKHHEQMLAVPLLALLVALICAETPDTDLPRGRAALLHEAIKQAVERWERDRDTVTGGAWAPDLTPAKLLDGFVVLGRLLEGSSRLHERDAHAALVTMLGDATQWSLAPAAAREVASDIVRFWDAHVAVFVVDGVGDLTSRSKVFAEIATAMWTLDAPADQVKHWLQEAVEFVDSDGAIALAADLNPTVVPALVVVGNSQPQAATLLATLAKAGTVTLSLEQSASCLDQLITLVRNAKGGGAAVGRPRKTADEDGLRDLLSQTGPRTVWDVVALVCAMPLFGANIGRRTALVEAASLSEPASTIARALSGLTDAATHERSLTSEELAAVRAVLELPLPDDSKGVKRTRRGLSVWSGGALIPGVAAVAAAAVRHLDQLPHTAPHQIFQITMKGPMIGSDAVFKSLAAAGEDTSDKNHRFSFARLGDWLSQYKEQKTKLLTYLASLAPERMPREDRDESNWSVTDLADLIEASRWGSLDAREMWHSLEVDGERLPQDFLDAVADAFGLDKDAVAEQARYLLGLSSEKPEGPDDGDAWFVVSTDPIDSPELVDAVGHVLSLEQHATLLTCLEAKSDWLADGSAFILANVAEKHPWDSVELFNKELPGRSRHRVTTIRLVAIFTAGDLRPHLLTEASTSDDPDYRTAARRAVVLAPALDPRGTLLRTMSRDPDLSVRPRDARMTEPLAVRWSCELCRTPNDIDVEDCIGCEDGVRPTQKD
jgi:hypothetical protein